MYQEEFCIYQLPLEKKIGLPSGGYIQKKTQNKDTKMDTTRTYPSVRKV
jgi:hypothetical protein